MFPDVVTFIAAAYTEGALGGPIPTYTPGTGIPAYVQATDASARREDVDVGAPRGETVYTIFTQSDPSALAGRQIRTDDQAWVLSGPSGGMRFQVKSGAIPQANGFGGTVWAMDVLKVL